MSSALWSDLEDCFVGRTGVHVFVLVSVNLHRNALCGDLLCVCVKERESVRLIYCGSISFMSILMGILHLRLAEGDRCL